MNSLQDVSDYLGRFGFMAWVLLIGALILALTLLKTPLKRTVAVLVILGLFAAYPGRWAWEVKQRVDRYKVDQAEFDRLCKDVAGFKIYKVVEDVEAIQLLKVRHRINDADPMAPGAAFALESKDDGYIDTFLSYRYPSRQMDGSYDISTTKGEGAIPGFSYVDVIDEKDGQRYRVTGSQKATGKSDVNSPMVKKALEKDPNVDLNIYNWRLDRTPAPNPAPRYAVTFEDHVIPEERARGLASSTVKVIDTQANEVLAEMRRYAWSPGVASAGNPSPWLTAYKCPGVLVGSGTATRQFVDRVLVARGATLPPTRPYPMPTIAKWAQRGQRHLHSEPMSQ